MLFIYIYGIRHKFLRKNTINSETNESRMPHWENKFATFVKKDEKYFISLRKFSTFVPELLSNVKKAKMFARTFSQIED